MYPDGNMSSVAFSSYPCHQDNPAVFDGILNSGRLVAIFTGLEHAGLLYLVRFAVESQGNDYCQFKASVYRRRMGPTSRGIHLEDLVLIPLPLGGHLRKK